MSELVLHERTKTLVDGLSGRLPHALIIDGPVGIGVRAVAEQLAASMGSPAMVITPKKSVNGQMVTDESEGSVIIGDIRELYERTRTRQPGATVYVIDTGERTMTVAAQNAFLKLLEEPREGLHFIIATHFYDQLLPTIRSRSQRLSLFSVTDAQTAALVQRLGITDATKAARLSFVGRGLPALITRLASDEKTYEKRVTIMSDAKTMISGDALQKLMTTHRYKDSRLDAVTLLDDMNHQLQVVLRKSPDTAYAAAITRHLETRSRILAGGNIRLQLAHDVLQ